MPTAELFSTVVEASQFTTREKLVSSGLFLAKYDKAGLKRLGFTSFIEAFNVIGLALGGKPASLKNYRDEFDPLFSHRKGWHKRRQRDYCLRIFDQFKDMDFESFALQIQSFFGLGMLPSVADAEKRSSETFAKRLMTGAAAERYFESVVTQVPAFDGCKVENTTTLGCGYDFCLRPPATDMFFAVEVKGLSSRKGTVSLTEREHAVASDLKELFFLFVVKNFRETPFHEIYRNPIHGDLRFEMRERIVVQRIWSTQV